MRLEAGANHSSEKASIFEPRGAEIRSYLSRGQRRLKSVEGKEKHWGYRCKWS